jgi:hypothetical protein
MEGEGEEGRTERGGWKADLLVSFLLSQHVQNFLSDLYGRPILEKKNSTNLWRRKAEKIFTGKEMRRRGEEGGST